eukprot:CAMPEP_0202913640 /NCGR_PEP_ID=MMETSP1392-20130828/61010_1 /ASSEMBLY_ACC=CAM_ASM_000868 /TAXON_ID=225041 /ORGANISM="Chlamydomonas chlamydogama, Strain SAG 11-48b" /LENGTH=139 /DNA_ID=CAMNT_0049604963 /DNA_START=151 /DNA_END=568 /DNA_ORIENTATION=+
MQLRADVLPQLHCLQALTAFLAADVDLGQARAARQGQAPDVQQVVRVEGTQLVVAPRHVQALRLHTEVGSHAAVIVPEVEILKGWKVKTRTKAPACHKFLQEALGEVAATSFGMPGSSAASSPASAAPSPSASAAASAA